MSDPHEGLSRAAPATEEPARPHIPEPYDAQAGGGKLIPVHGEGDILVLIVGALLSLVRESRMVESSFTITAGKLALAIWGECDGSSIGNQGAGLSPCSEIT